MVPSDIIKNVKVYGLEESIRGAKFPMSIDVNSLTTELTPGIRKLGMSSIGEGHDNFLNGIIVQFDLMFTVKAWTEAERYHFFDFVSSQSTMHRITKMDLDSAYIEYVDPQIIEIMKEKVKNFNNLGKNATVEEIEKMYLEILYSSPVGLRLTARMTTDYRQLKTIYKQRKNHRLPEWQVFAKWCESLPHSEFITGTSEADIRAKEILVDLANQYGFEKKYTIEDSDYALAQALMLGSFKKGDNK